MKILVFMMIRWSEAIVSVLKGDGYSVEETDHGDEGLFL